MENPLIKSGKLRKRDRLAVLLRRVPKLTGLMQLGFRYAQARYTAGVVGVVFNEFGEILIVEHVFHPMWSWGLPGGWLARAEDPADGLCRELCEETGLQVTVLRPLLIKNGYYYHTHLDISFLCRAESKLISLGPELLNCDWVRPNAVPRLLPFHTASIEAAQQQPEYEVFL